MLIPIDRLVKKYQLNIRGILHVGAHELEELDTYHAIGVKNIVWVEGNPVVYDKMRLKFPDSKLYCGLVSDKDDQVVEFIVTNNGQSSSILELEEHKTQHPHVVESYRMRLPTITLSSLFKKNELSFDNYNFLNIDIQGAELLALKGLGEELRKFDYLYLEVNTKHLYKDCPLLTDLMNYLMGFGFKLAEIEMTEFFWGDAFFVKK